MAYLLEHTKLGFCWWDLLALLILLAVVIVYLVRRHNLKKERKSGRPLIRLVCRGFREGK